MAPSSRSVPCKRPLDPSCSSMGTTSPLARTWPSTRAPSTERRSPWERRTTQVGSLLQSSSLCPMYRPATLSFRSSTIGADFRSRCPSPSFRPLRSLADRARQAHVRPRRPLDLRSALALLFRRTFSSRVGDEGSIVLSGERFDWLASMLLHERQSQRDEIFLNVGCNRVHLFVIHLG